MKLAHRHRARGDDVVLAEIPSPSMFEPSYDRVYGSAIFEWSAPLVKRLREAFPDALVGGTGSGMPYSGTVEHHLGVKSTSTTITRYIPIIRGASDSPNEAAV